VPATKTGFALAEGARQLALLGWKEGGRALRLGVPSAQNAAL